MSVHSAVSAMNSIIQQLFEYFLEDFIYYGTPTGNEKETVSLYVEPNCAAMYSEDCFPLKEKLTEELFGKSHWLCSKCIHGVSVCDNEKCKNYAEFKKTESHLFVVLGGSGIGKTTCALNLAKFYWEKITKFPSLLKYKTIIYDVNVIPIYINLQSVKGNWSNVLQSYLQTKGMMDLAAYNDICNMKNVLLILDAYDEIASSYINDTPDDKNIWDNNNWGDSNLKAVLFSRPECFESLPKIKRFFSYTKSGCNDKLSAKVFLIQPYTDEHIASYMNQFINLLSKTPKVCVKNVDNGNLFAMTKFVTHGTKWETKRSPYHKWLGQNELSPAPQLKQLASSPLLLTLIMLVLPGVASREKNNEIEMIKICSTETGLYDEFLCQWFSFQCKKMKNSQKCEEFSNIFDYLPNLLGMYAQNLATFVLKKSGGYLTENYELTESDTLQPNLLEPYHDKRLRDLKKNDEAIKDFFSGDKNENIQILRDGCPLHFYHNKYSPREGFRCRFIHISLIEFLISRDVFQYVRGEINYFIYREISQSNNSYSNFHLSNDSIGITYQAINGPNVNSKVLYLLADRAKNNKEFSELLLKIVKISSETSVITLSPRTQFEREHLHFSLLHQTTIIDNEKQIYIQDEINQLSANCMTILILSGRNFSDENLRNVQIPGADLRNGIFAGADLRGANCEGCNFGHTMLTNAKLQGSNLKDIIVDQDKIEIDALLDDEPYIMSCFDNFLYCSFKGKIVQCDLDSGKIVQVFILGKHPKLTYDGDLIRLEFIVSSKKLFVWSDSMDSIHVFDLETGQPLVGISAENIYATGNSVGKKETLEEKQGVVQLFPYSFHSTECNKSRAYVLRLYNLHEKLNVIVVTVHSHNIMEKIICFPWTTVSQINFESLFPIYCYFTGCAVNETKGYFALAEEDGLKIYSLFTGKLIQTFNDVSWSALHSVVVKFNHGGQFLGLLCREDNFSSSKFHLLRMTNDKVGMVNMTKCFSEIAIPETFIFSNNDDVLATEHHFNQSYQINVWTVVGNQLTPLHVILNHLPCRRNFDLFVQYTFSRDDTSIAYLRDFSETYEIHIVGTHVLKSKFTVEKSERVIASAAISNDGKYRAVLSYDNIEETHEKQNLEIFENQVNFPKLLTHQAFYPTNSVKTRSSLENLSFDKTNKYLLVIGTDLTIFFVCVETGSIIRHVNLSTPVPLIEEQDVLRMYSNFEILPKFCRLIVMYSHKKDQMNKHSEFLAMWNLDKVNQNEILKRDLFELINTGTEVIKGICQDFDGNWFAACTGDGKVCIWSIKNVATFRTFHSPIKSKDCQPNFLLSVKFGPKAGSDSVFMILSRLTVLHVVKVSGRKIQICRTIKTDDLFEFGEIECINNSLCFAIITYSFIYIRNMSNKKFCVPLKLWYEPDGCRLVSIIENGTVDQNHFLIYSWGMQSNQQIFSCIKMNYRSGRWKIVWSSKPSYELQASDCNIGNCYELNSNSFNSLSKFGIKGKPLKLSGEYIPLPRLFSEYITNEDRSERQDPIIFSDRRKKFYITENSWTISVVIKKYSNKCSRECSTPHMLLIIEGMRNGRRFIFKAHKRYDDIDKIAIVSLERMDDIERFRNYAKSVKANQWEITKEEGMVIIHSIQDDQQREDLRFNLLNKNCVEWCRSKIQLIPRYKNVGQKKFLLLFHDLIVAPRYLLNAN